MDYHRNVLTNLCRICGLRALKAREIKAIKKARVAKNYTELIKLYLVCTENKEVRPFTVSSADWKDK